MFIPAHYRNADPAAACAWLARYPFGTLITAGADGLPMATSLPVFAEADDAGTIRIVSHLARRNPHATALRSGLPGLLVVNSPSAYISPAWYQSPMNVPTWDYVGLQMAGTLKVIDEREALLDLMRRSIRVFESAAGTDWTLDQAPTAHVDRLIQGVIGFELSVERLDCMEKLSQNKPTDRPVIQAALRASGTGLGPLVANLMDQVSG